MLKTIAEKYNFRHSIRNLECLQRSADEFPLITRPPFTNSSLLYVYTLTYTQPYFEWNNDG